MYADIEDKTKLTAIINCFWIVNVLIASKKQLTVDKVIRDSITSLKDNHIVVAQYTDLWIKTNCNKKSRGSRSVCFRRDGIKSNLKRLNCNFIKKNKEKISYTRILQASERWWCWKDVCHHMDKNHDTFHKKNGINMPI